MKTKKKTLKEFQQAKKRIAAGNYYSKGQAKRILAF